MPSASGRVMPANRAVGAFILGRQQGNMGQNLKGSVMNFRLNGWLGVALALATAPALAQDERTPFFEERPYYVSPALSYIIADDDRGTDDGLGATVSLGKKVTAGMSLELIGAFAQMQADAGAGLIDNGDFQLFGIGVGAMVFPMKSLPNLYGRINLMHGSGQDAPGLIRNYDTTLFDAGVGYLLPVTRKLAIRGEALYRKDNQNRREAGVQPGDNRDFYDGVFNVGIVYRFGESVADRRARSQCPDTPAGVEVDETGCPIDSDGDGVADYLDQCPDTPAGKEVNDEGCVTDRDGDGIPDSEDQCPDSPAGAKVMEDGCALFGDCRKPKAGEAVDENGCALDKGFILRGVKFEFDSDRLTEEAKRILNGVAEVLDAYADVDVDVEGHTDQIGSDAYNLGLSERRANAVKTYLAGKGVEADRMTPVGYGRSQPIADNSTEEGREENRRVELRPTRD
jgi:OmpA-OmpF porin, OOP family